MRARAWFGPVVLMATMGAAAPLSPPASSWQVTGSTVGASAVARSSRAAPPPARQPARSSARTDLSGVGSVVPQGRWVWPLQPRPVVERRFRPPASRYGSGHRGVDLAAAVGQAVLAVNAGTVSHVGVIAGRGTVTVRHLSGIRSTYEPVRSTLRVEDVVARGQPVGRLEPMAGHCAPLTCLHLGAVRGHAYLDPLQLLRPSHVILLPLR